MTMGGAIFATARAALTTVALAHGPTLAATEMKVVGDWLVKVDQDRFSGATNVIAARLDGGYGLSVRCLDRRLSLLVGSLTDEPFDPADDLFLVRFRADKADVIDTLAEALDRKSAQIVMHDRMMDQLQRAHEVAFRFHTKRTQFDVIISLGRSERAISTVAKACATK